MNRNAVTERYLAEVARRALGPDDLPGHAAGRVDLSASTYMGRCLSRPVFLDRAEQEQLATDLNNLLSALTRLPERLFGGDLAAFARAAAMTEAQVTAIQRTSGQPPTQLSRADLYHDGSEFRLLELNMGSTLGFLDNAILNQAFLSHPAMAEFAAANQLSYVDTHAATAETLRAECDVPTGHRPLVAAADWPASFPEWEAQLWASAAALKPFGIDAIPCHLGQLRARDGRIWLDDRPVDVIYRVFMIEDLLDPSAPELVDPVLRAVERGEVKIFVPMDAELYGSKAALAMLSDEEHRHRYDPTELASLDRILPWTRMVRPGPVTVDGELVDLWEYAIERREELALKPTALHGGSGVLLGWQTDPDHWHKQLRSALDGPWVLQRRIRGAPEPFPAAGGLEPWLLSWGVFTVHGGYGGAMARGSTELDGGVVNMATGATATCCFHETA